MTGVVCVGGTRILLLGSAFTVSCSFLLLSFFLSLSFPLSGVASERREPTVVATHVLNNLQHVEYVLVRNNRNLIKSRGERISLR